MLADAHDAEVAVSDCVAIWDWVAKVAAYGVKLMELATPATLAYEDEMLLEAHEAELAAAGTKLIA